jgi:hypothetical protein
MPTRGQQLGLLVLLALLIVLALGRACAQPVAI